MRPEFLIPITDHILWLCSPGCSIPELLCSPFVSRKLGDGSVYNFAALKLNEHKYVQGLKEQVVNNSEITSPDLTGMVLQEGFPSLACFFLLLEHVLLNGAFADLDP